jgi:hypothetical protein
MKIMKDGNILRKMIKRPISPLPEAVGSIIEAYILILINIFPLIICYRQK